MTVDDITQVLNKMQGDKWEGVMLGLGIPLPLQEEILRRYSTDAEKKRACADYYVNYHPKAEWEELTSALYIQKEFTAATKSKTFMPTGRYCHYTSRLLMQLLCSLISTPCTL